MKIIKIIVLSLAFSASSFAQDSISIKGIWEVSELLRDDSPKDIWQFGDGDFCELK